MTDHDAGEALERPLHSTLLTRRRLLGAGITGAALAGRSLVLQSGASAADPRHPGILFDDRTRRALGPVLFLGDSTTSRRWHTIQHTAAADGVGPFRIDLQPGRFISRSGGWGASAVQAVQDARAARMDAPAYVIALGFPDIVHWRDGAAPLHDSAGIAATIGPLLEEIGRLRTVGFLNLYSTGGGRTAAFNDALGRLRPSWPNLHVLDWAAVARQHGKQWTLPDGYHPNNPGATARNTFVAHAMRDMALVTRVRTRP